MFQASRRSRLSGVITQLLVCFSLFSVNASAAASKANDPTEVLDISATEVEQLGPLQRLAEIQGNWEVVDEQPPAAAEETSLLGDIWTFNRDASFISRHQGQHRGDAHFYLNLRQLEISQTGARKQYLLLILNQDQLQLQEILHPNNLLGQDTTDAPAPARQLTFRRSEIPAGQGPASIYYTPRQVATMQVLLTCGRLNGEQLELLFPTAPQKADEPLANQADNRLPKTASVANKSAKTRIQFRSILEQAEDGEKLAQQRQVMDQYIFNHIGIRSFEWPLYLSSKQYYQSDPLYNSVFPGIIKRGIRRCLN